MVKAVPAALERSEALGRWLGAALLLYFGVRTLRDAWAQPADSSAGEELEEAEQSGKPWGKALCCWLCAAASASGWAPQVC